MMLLLLDMISSIISISPLLEQEYNDMIMMIIIVMILITVIILITIKTITLVLTID